MILLLMAAGRGSRYGKLKQFDELGPHKEFLLEFSVSDALKSGFNHFVVITQKTNVQFLKDYLAERLPKGIKLDVLPQDINDLPNGVMPVVNREKPWGTAHAVWSARNVIDKPFAVINTDDYYGENAYKNAASFIKNIEKNTFGLVAYPLNATLSDNGPVSRGICKVENEYLQSIEEQTKLEKQQDVVVDLVTEKQYSGNERVSMNFWVCLPSIFQQIEKDISAFFKVGNDLEKGEIYLPYVIKNMMLTNDITVKVLATDSKWFGVTYANDKEKAVHTLAEMTTNGFYNNPLWSTVYN